jgi:hypothetical protein
VALSVALCGLSFPQPLLFLTPSPISVPFLSLCFPLSLPCPFFPSILSCPLLPLPPGFSLLPHWVEGDTAGVLGHREVAGQKGRGQGPLGAGSSCLSVTGAWPGSVPGGVLEGSWTPSLSPPIRAHRTLWATFFLELHRSPARKWPNFPAWLGCQGPGIQVPRGTEGGTPPLCGLGQLWACPVPTHLIVHSWQRTGSLPIFPTLLLCPTQGVDSPHPMTVSSSTAGVAAIPWKGVAASPWSSGPGKVPAFVLRHHTSGNSPEGNGSRKRREGQVPP